MLVGIVGKLWQKGKVGCSEKKEKELWHISCVPPVLISTLLIAVSFVQIFLFHGAFVFGDNVVKEDSYARVEENPLLTGMLTTGKQAESLGGLTAFIHEHELEGRKTIVWSEAPILYYLLDVECAIGHFWPWLESYPYEELKNDINKMEDYPVIIYQASKFTDLTEEAPFGDRRSLLIHELLKEGAYNEIFRNEEYVICLPAKEK